MARVKNASFVGSPMVDVDVDTLTFQRTIKDAVGDSARAYDRATGSNGETGTMIHDGAGRGCLLGIPWCNQWIGRNVGLRNATSGVAKHGGDGATYLAAAPFYVPPGENTAVVQVWKDGLLACPYEQNAEAVVYTTSGTVVVRAPFLEGTAVLDGLADGEHILTIEVVTRVILAANTFDSISIHTGRVRGAGASPTRSTADDYGVTDPGTSPIWWRDFDSEMFSPGLPINGFIIAGLNRSQHGLFEYLTGWPAGDNVSYTHEDNTGQDPTRSEFLAHARAGFASEGVPSFPVQMVFLGAAKRGYFVVDAVEPPTEGMLEWYAPWPKTSAALPLAIAKQRINWPDMPVVAGMLHVSVLALQGPAFAGTWSMSTEQAGAHTATANFAAVGGGTNLLRAKTTFATFQPDNVGAIAVSVNRTAGVRAVGEIAILGYSFWISPP